MCRKQKPYSSDDNRTPIIQPIMPSCTFAGRHDGSAFIKLSSRRRRSHHHTALSSQSSVNPLVCIGNYTCGATSNGMKLVHWPSMGGLLHLVHQGGAWAGCGPTQTPPCCTKCNSPPINRQCTNHRIDVQWSVALLL